MSEFDTAMMTTKLFPALAVITSVYLSACSSTGTSGYNASSIADASLTANAVGSAAVGDTISLPEGNPTGSSSADVIAEYFAASNRRCRQVLPHGGKSVRIACQTNDGSWVWVRSLTTSEVAQPLPALVTVGAAEPIVVVGQSREQVSTEIATSYAGRIDVQPGETLWKFSHRTTGSGVHWQAIAELNDIDDARTISSGMALFVPPHLAIGQ